MEVMLTLPSLLEMLLKAQLLFMSIGSEDLEQFLEISIVKMLEDHILLSLIKMNIILIFQVKKKRQKQHLRQIV